MESQTTSNKELVAMLDSCAEILEKVRSAIADKDNPVLDPEVRNVVDSDIQQLRDRNVKVTIQNLVQLHKDSNKSNPYADKDVKRYVKSQKTAISNISSYVFNLKEQPAKKRKTEQQIQEQQQPAKKRKTEGN